MSYQKSRRMNRSSFQWGYLEAGPTIEKMYAYALALDRLHVGVNAIGIGEPSTLSSEGQSFIWMSGTRYVINNESLRNNHDSPFADVSSTDSHIATALDEGDTKEKTRVLSRKIEICTSNPRVEAKIASASDDDTTFKLITKRIRAIGRLYHGSLVSGKQVIDFVDKKVVVSRAQVFKSSNLANMRSMVNEVNQSILSALEVGAQAQAEVEVVHSLLRKVRGDAAAATAAETAEGVTIGDRYRNQLEETSRAYRVLNRGVIEDEEDVRNMSAEITRIRAAADKNLKSVGRRVIFLRQRERELAEKCRLTRLHCDETIATWQPQHKASLFDLRLRKHRIESVCLLVAVQSIQTAARWRLLLYLRRGIEYRYNRRGLIIPHSVRITDHRRAVILRTQLLQRDDNMPPQSHSDSDLDDTDSSFM